MERHHRGAHRPGNRAFSAHGASCTRPWRLRALLGCVSVSEFRIPVVLALDVEPDDPEFVPNSRAPWLGFEAAVDLFAAIRDRLARATECDVHLSWFVRMDPQIAQGYGSAMWFVEQYSTEIAALRSAGDEIGLHTHAWR